MNDPSKRIDVNLSSLLSLKAELLRKRAEVSAAKSTQVSADEYIPKRKTNNSSDNIDDQKHNGGKSKNNQTTKKSDSKDENVKVYECEDQALLEKSRRVLEAKSKFYDRMSRSGGKLNTDDNCLVQFNRKRQEATDIPTHRRSSSSDLSSSSDSDTGNDDDENDWVEFTDCLGRTRKCLRKDLKENKRKDAELAAAMPERLDQSKANWMLDTHVARQQDDNDVPIGPMPPASVVGDNGSFMSLLDEQKYNWERKEGENLEKSDLHYQDVFFDEARQHGVGYYAFSTDEEERRKQQRQLEELRLATLNEQKQRDNLRAQREKIIAQRVLAAKNRQRARQGLPPLEEKDVEAEKEAEKIETKEERRERKREEKKKRKLEQLEKEREEERLRHVRPWDENKNSAGVGVKRDFDADEDATKEWAYKPERLPMSQEEWNEQQRAARVAEFGPMPAESMPPPPPMLKRTNFTSVPPPPLQRSYNNFTMVPTPPPPPPSYAETYTSTTASGSSWRTGLEDKNFASFQSSKQQVRTFQRRNYESKNEIEEQQSRGAAIPPPAGLDDDCYLPSHKKRARPESELERSIEAGLKFLRENSDKDTMSTKSSWTAKADY